MYVYCIQMYLYCIYSTYILYRSVCPLVIYSDTIQDEVVNPLTHPPSHPPPPRKYNVLDGNFVFNLSKVV